MTEPAKPNEPCKIFRFVRHGDIPAFTELGWIVHRSLNGTHHGQYSALLEWPFQDRIPVEPEAKEVPLAG